MWVDYQTQIVHCGWNIFKTLIFVLGIQLESGKQYSQVLERSFHVSMAALGRSFVYVVI